jgi:hypothetical protein
VTGVGRLFLVLWLALFAVQTSDLVAAVAPDGCLAATGDPAGDSCPDGCARCICCARVSLFVPHVVPAGFTGTFADIPAHPIVGFASSAEPHGILHVPKTR